MNMEQGEYMSDESRQLIPAPLRGIAFALGVVIIVWRLQPPIDPGNHLNDMPISSFNRHQWVQWIDDIKQEQELNLPIASLSEVNLF